MNQPLTYAAVGPKGNVVRTFNAWDLAVCYQAAMMWIGTPVTIRQIVQQQRRS